MDSPPSGRSGDEDSKAGSESEDDEGSFSPLNCLPEDLLLQIFCYLSAQSVLNCSLMCKRWYRIASDELLWKKLFYHDYNIDPSIPMSPGRKSWMEEYKRLSYHTPAIESQVICEHKDQVLHVSFSHNGEMFATCSKDGFVKVWNSSYLVTLKYEYNMKNLTWKYTQFSQFNETDTLLLVSGVHFGVLSTSGEIAVFSLVGEFQLQCRVLNKPYDVFGTWYNSNYLLSGSLLWFGPLQSCSALWLNKAFQATDSEHESVVMRLYRFNNVNASSIRAIMIADCVTEEEGAEEEEGEERNSKNANQQIPKGSTGVSPSSSVASNSRITLGGALTSNNDRCAVGAKNPQQKSPIPVTLCTRAHNCPNCLKRRAEKKAQEQALASANQNQKKRSCKTLQCLTIMENGRLQSRMLEVEGEDSDEQLNGTIEYNKDYRKAEISRHESSPYSKSEILQHEGSPDPRAEISQHEGSPDPRAEISQHESSPDPKPEILRHEASLDPRAEISQHEGSPDPRAEISQHEGSPDRRVEISQHEGSPDCKEHEDLTASKENHPNAKCQCVSKNKCLGEYVSVDSEKNKASIEDTSTADIESSSCQCGCIGQSDAAGWSKNAKDVRPVPASSEDPSTANANTSVLEDQSVKNHNQKFPPKFRDKYLIFTTGSKTYTPHQIGIKKVQSLEALRYENVEETGEGVRLMPNVEDSQPGSPLKFDEVDHLIELDGHIIGMCLSPDHRYLYVNSRPWPENYYIENPLYPPPIAQEIDIHVIDLLHMQEVGTMHRSHKAYTPNDECFFIFLDVCDEFVASGAEDKFGYLWDRHYGLCLHKFPHKDVVNSVAFHPKNREMLVTVSDDHTVKVWHSRNLERKYRLERERAEAALAKEKTQEQPVLDPLLDTESNFEAALDLEPKHQ